MARSKKTQLNESGLPVGRALTQEEVDQHNSRERVRLNREKVAAAEAAAAPKPKKEKAE